MKSKIQWISLHLAMAFLAASTLSSHAFALLGPAQPWMEASNGVIFPMDLGGPMPIGSGYRWNVPVVTYGFDQSFLSFFGSNGVAAVESAIAYLNDLPPATQMVLTNYPFMAIQTSPSTQAKSVTDLKSQTMTALLNHLGLAQPERYIYVLHDLDAYFAARAGSRFWVGGMPIYYDSLPGDPTDIYPLTNYIAGFDFDPETLDATSVINGVPYDADISFFPGTWYVDTVPVSDPLAIAPVAGGLTRFGSSYVGLTYDDIGGLRYLYSTNTVNYEGLLDDVQGVGTNSLTRGAWRPGVDKVMFVRQPTGAIPGSFSPLTNRYTDSYLTNGLLVQQQLERVTIQPDFVFSAGNDWFQTGTTNWVNNSVANGNPNGQGPGVIQPPVKIVFPKYGPYYESLSNPSPDTIRDLSSYWGSIDGSTNAPIVFPMPQSGAISLVMRIYLSHSNNALFFQTYQWLLTSDAGSVYSFQTTTNLSVWTTLFEVTNNGSICTFHDDGANNAARFYRLISP